VRGEGGGGAGCPGLLLSDHLAWTELGYVHFGCLRGRRVKNWVGLLCETQRSG
jgi:hypothetical protein